MDLTQTQIGLLLVIDGERRVPTSGELSVIGYELQKLGLVRPGGCCGMSLLPEGEQALRVALLEQVGPSAVN